MKTTARWLTPLGVAILLVHPWAGFASHLKVSLNPGWRFHFGIIDNDASAISYDDSAWDLVSLPHSHRLYNANLTGFRQTGRSSGWYRRQLEVPRAWIGKRISIEFQGAMEESTLWVNGSKVGAYSNGGFDSFEFDITRYLHEGQNLVAVFVDNRPKKEIPPDGVEADYVLFGGLYRDVYLHVTDPVHLTFPCDARQAGVRVTLPEISDSRAVVNVTATVRNESGAARDCSVAFEVWDGERKITEAHTAAVHLAEAKENTFSEALPPILGPKLWSPATPVLYKVITRVIENGRELDREVTPFGLRWVRFDKERGFFLNGKPLKLIGVNRHQTWPFIGGAVPNELQREDAQQIKAMGANWVRLSHYPQDPDFLDALDELGIMALEEPATWMATCPGEWMNNLETSFRRMIRRDRNHPSIIVWGACINHHGGEPRLIAAAKEEDPTRDRGQDTVSTPMDFIPGVVSGGGALSVEHTGHTFPAARGERLRITRMTDGGNGTIVTNINREYELAKRHWEQLNAAYQKPDNSGVAVWCMYDYNTFHNVEENGLVWHGICDLFRIPKYSYWWHVSELTQRPMVYVVKIDETHAAVFSNCEQVRLLQDGGRGYEEVATQSPDKGYFTQSGQYIDFALKHPPFHFQVSGKAIALKAEGLIQGATRASYEWRQFGPATRLTLETDRTRISADGSDLSRIIVTAVDKSGTPVDNSTASVSFSITGFGQLIGENPARLRAGKTIILAQSGFVPDEITITATAAGLEPSQIKVKTEAVSGDVNMPIHLAAQQPTRQVLDLPSSRSGGLKASVGNVRRN